MPVLAAKRLSCTFYCFLPRYIAMPLLISDDIKIAKDVRKSAQVKWPSHILLLLTTIPPFCLVHPQVGIMICASDGTDHFVPPLFVRTVHVEGVFRHQGHCFYITS